MYHLLIVSALYLGSCNCSRHHLLCFQNHPAQSQSLPTLILRHWAEPPCPLPSLGLVTVNAVDKLIAMKKICLGFESVFQTVRLKRGLELISNALRRVTCIPYVPFLSWTSRQRKEISILLKFLSEAQLSKTSGFELVAKGPTQLFVRDTRWCHHNCFF